jgi:hypothetical protein
MSVSSSSSRIGSPLIPCHPTDDSLAEILFPYDAPSTPDDDPQTSTNSEKRKAIPATTIPVVRQTDLVPLETKRELVLRATEDIKDAERMLREIQLLVDRGVDGSGDLAREYLRYRSIRMTDEFFRYQCMSRLRNV